MPISDKKWDSSTPLDQFIKGSGVSNDVRVTLSHADTDDQYATEILDLLGALSATDMAFHLFVNVGSTYVFGWNWANQPGQAKMPDRALILETIAGLTGNP